MTKTLTAIAAASVLTLASTSAFAGCFGNHVKMSTAAEDESIISTYDGDLASLETDIATTEPCAEGDTSCETDTAE